MGKHNEDDKCDDEKSCSNCALLGLCLGNVDAIYPCPEYIEET